MLISEDLSKFSCVDELRIQNVITISKPEATPTGFDEVMTFCIRAD